MRLLAAAVRTLATFSGAASVKLLTTGQALKKFKSCPRN